MTPDKWRYSMRARCNAIAFILTATDLETQRKALEADTNRSVYADVLLQAVKTEIERRKANSQESLELHDGYSEVRWKSGRAKRVKESY